METPCLWITDASAWITGPVSIATHTLEHVTVIVWAAAKALVKNTVTLVDLTPIVSTVYVNAWQAGAQSTEAAVTNGKVIVTARA